MKTGIYRAGICQTRTDKQSGFTYLLVLIAVVVIGIIVGGATTLVSFVMQQDREAELLFRGLAYKNAIESYYLASKDKKIFPQSMADLLEDPRVPGVRRHLRTLYEDPMSPDNEGEINWDILRSSDGGIQGVVSRSLTEPIKQAGFPKGLELLEQQKSYNDWQFLYMPPAANKIEKAKPKTP